MKTWRSLGGGRKAFYLLTPGLPLLGFVLLFALPGFDFGAPGTGGFWGFILALPLLGFLLGAANLLLIFLGHPPEENIDLWHALMAASLVPSLVLLGVEAFMLLALGMMKAGTWPAPQ